MGFSAWLITQAHRNDLVGEIAQQAVRHKYWPKADDLVCFRVYLALGGATPLAIHAVEIAFEEWWLSKDLPIINAIGGGPRKVS